MRTPNIRFKIRPLNNRCFNWLLIKVKECKIVIYNPIDSLASRAEIGCMGYRESAQMIRVLWVQPMEFVIKRWLLSSAFHRLYVDNKFQSRVGGTGLFFL